MRLLNANKDFGAGGVPTTYIENHDHAQIASNAGGRSNWFRTQPWVIALLTCPGACLIYNGQEFAEDYWMPEHHEETHLIKRVVPRPKRWQYQQDATGQSMFWRYHRMIQIRHDHPGLRSPHFYPPEWNESHRHFGSQGNGIDADRALVIYHRWGNDGNGQLERFIVVLNFAPFTQTLDIPFSTNGVWADLISGWQVTVEDHWLRNQQVGGNWGHVFWKAG